MYKFPKGFTVKNAQDSQNGRDYFKNIVFRNYISYAF